MKKGLLELFLLFVLLPNFLIAQNPLPPILSDCEAIEYTAENNDLIISKITASNAIVKIFDHDWQLAFECNADCEETISLSNLTTGDIYHTDIQFYDENWQYICSDKQDLEILGDAPCDDSVCLGDVILSNQAEVDAFCGCEVIEGNLRIGSGPINNALNDIISLQNLTSIKQVKGNLVIAETQLTDLTGLDNLNYVGSAGLVLNPNLISVKGLENLIHVNSGLAIRVNETLVDLDGFESLAVIKTQLHIQGNHLLTSIKGLSKIKKATLVNVISNASLESLEGLENLDSIFASNQSTGLLIADNASLTDISSLKGLKHIAKGMTITANNVLEDCCAITHLIDEDANNGQVLGTINIIDNPSFCSSIAEILEKCDNSTPINCDVIEYITGNNNLIISGITAPNAIVKIFDHNWQLAFECNADCEETISLSGLIAGDIYHTDIQFYDANWQYICSDKQDIEILGGDPCADSVCQGDVILNTQAEMDAFCGCEVIEGELVIGYKPVSNAPNSNINLLQGLENLKQVKGNLTISKTQLADLSGLNALERIGGFILLENENLENVNSLAQLTEIDNGFISIKNFKLTNIDGLSNLRTLQSISIGETGIEDLSALQQLDVSTLSSLDFTGCPNLRSLAGLEGIQSYVGNGNGSVRLIGNPLLTDISALQNCTLIDGNLTFVDNQSMTGCCAIVHLVDENLTNGVINGNITLLNNPNFCDSVEEIVEECDGTPPFSCDNIDISLDNNTRSLTISNLTAPIEIVKVFDENWNQLYECFADCEETITLTELSASLLRIQIANYDENWNFLCHGDQDAAFYDSSEARNGNTLSAKDFSLSPNPAQEEAVIDLTRLKGESVTLKMYNQFGQEVYQKQIDQLAIAKEKIDLSVFSNGLYILQIQSKGLRPIGKKLMISRLY